MDQNKVFEDKLREAACFGDEDAVRKLVEKGVNINSQHEINGWTSMHWAAKRGHTNIISYLLSHGADKNIPTKKGELAGSLTDNTEIVQLLGGTATNKLDDKLPIVANYIAHPPMNYKVEVDGCGPMSQSKNPDFAINGFAGPKHSPQSNRATPHIASNHEPELVLKVRIAHTSDPDFIEVELPVGDRTYSRLVRVCSEELGIDPVHILKIRKLPDTILRKDKDIQRLNDFQELELVMSNQKCSDSRYNISPFTENHINAASSKPTFTNCKILY